MIKKVTERHYLEQIHDLGSYAFNSSHTESQMEAYIKKNTFINNFVDEEDGEVSSQIVSYPFEVSVHGTVMKMAGIGDVATYPEKRGSGGIRRLFEAIFKELHDNGTELSYLAPFSESFYRKFGYENLFYQDEIRIPKSVIQQIKPEKTGSLKRVKWEDEITQQTVKELYAKTLAKEHGSLIREDYWWEYNFIPEKNKKIAIAYDDNHEAVGYIVYSLISYTEFRIHELAYVTAPAFRQLLTFISSHSGSFEEFVSTNIKQPMLLTAFTDARPIQRKSNHYMMGRIVNFLPFIEKLPFHATTEEVSVVLEVKDTFCDWNQGLFELTIQNGVARCEKIVSGTPDYSGTIQEWLPVFMGLHSLDQAVWYGLIEKRTEEEQLSSLIQLETPRLYDYF